MMKISEVEAADLGWIDARLGVVRGRLSTTSISITMQQKQEMERAALGTVGEEAQQANDAIVAKLENVAAALQRLSDALEHARSSLNSSRERVLDSVSELRGQGWNVADDGTVSLTSGSPLAGYAKISPVNEMHVRQLAAENTMNLKTLLAQFHSDDVNAAAQIKAASVGT